MAFKSLDQGIPDAAVLQLEQLGDHGISVIAFAPGGGWVVITADGRKRSSDLPAALSAAIERALAARQPVRCVAFTPSGGWMLVTDRAVAAEGVPAACVDKATALGPARITCVAFARDGGWVVLAGRELAACSIDVECHQILRNFAQGERPAERVAFAPGGGWIALAHEHLMARRIPEPCRDAVGQLKARDFLVDHVAFAPSGGWVVASNTPNPYDAPDPLREMEERFFYAGPADGWRSVWERMEAHKALGMSASVVLDNRVAWSCAYGRLETVSPDLGGEALYTAAADLARSIARVNESITTDGAAPPDVDLSRAAADGGAVAREGQGARRVAWEKDGVLHGLTSHLRGYPSHKAGIAVLTSGEGGGALLGEILSAAVRTYRWD